MKNSKVLKEELAQGKYSQLLKEIYIDESMIPYQQERYQKAIESYEEIFGEGDVELYSAPGRSEVGGNHTDHQHGMVLATSINLDALAVVSRNDSNLMRVMSEGYEMAEVDMTDLKERFEETGTTIGLIRGVAAALWSDNLR